VLGNFSKEFFEWAVFKLPMSFVLLLTHDLVSVYSSSSGANLVILWMLLAYIVAIQIIQPFRDEHYHRVALSSLMVKYTFTFIGVVARKASLGESKHMHYFDVENLTIFAFCAIFIAVKLKRPNLLSLVTAIPVLEMLFLG